MKKLITKTALITVSIVIVVVMTIIACISIFAPKTMSKFFYTIGVKSIALNYAERQYNMKEDISDLETVIIISNECYDYTRIAKYSKILVENDGFSSLCAQNDATNKYAMTYRNYIYGNYAIALYKTNAEFSEVFAVANNTVDTLDASLGYTTYNAYTFLIYSDIGQSKDFWENIYLQLTEIDNLIDSQELTADIQTVTNKINSHN